MREHWSFSFLSVQVFVMDIGEMGHLFVGSTSIAI